MKKYTQISKQFELNFRLRVHIDETKLNIADKHGQDNKNLNVFVPIFRKEHEGKIIYFDNGFKRTITNFINPTTVQLDKPLAYYGKKEKTQDCCN